MATGRLTIGCVAAQYAVSAEHPSPRQVKDRLDAIIARDLPRTLARAFESWFSDSDQSIWIIRQLNIETAINVTGEPEHIIRALTTQIARKLDATLHSENQDNVRNFLNRAAYLASFLSDLAFGTAWSQWHYESFAGLKALPLSSALRTALCDDIDTGKEALGSLAAQELEKIVDSLTSQDARQVLGRLSSIDSVSDEMRSREAVSRAATKYQTILAKLGNEWQRALYLFVAAVREEKGLGGSSLQDAALAIATAKDRLSTAVAGADTQVLASSRSTAFGGIFLILPHLDELPLVEATRDWPHLDEAAAISLVRFLLLLKCCGSEAARRAFYDPLVRDLLLIPPSLSPEVLRTWQSQIKREHLQNFLTTLIDRQCSRGAIGGKEQLLIISQFRNRELLVLIDAARGLWLLVDGYSMHRAKKIMAALHLSLSMLIKQEGVLYSDTSVIGFLRLNLVGLNVINLSDHRISPAGAEKRAVDTILARLDKLPEELEFLTLPRSFRVARPLDLALSIVAQHLLRGVAYRLPGFAGSNLAYLSRNFFDFGATLEEEPARRVVRLGQAPLHLVLNMTGMNRQSYRLSWLDERAFALFQSE
jgi:hypothetical protein